MAKKNQVPYVYKTEAEFQAAVAKAVAQVMAEGQKGGHALTQDQHDMLTIVCPNKAARHDYKIVEPENV